MFEVNVQVAVVYELTWNDPDSFDQREPGSSKRVKNFVTESEAKAFYKKEYANNPKFSNWQLVRKDIIPLT